MWTIKDLIFLITELGILVFVIWGVIIEIRTDKKIDMQLQYTLNKGKHHKKKSLQDKIQDL